MKKNETKSKMQNGGASISLTFQVMRKSRIIFESFGEMILSNDKTVLQISVLTGNDACAWSSNDCFYFFITSISICPTFVSVYVCVCRACMCVFIGLGQEKWYWHHEASTLFSGQQYAVILLYHKSISNDYALAVQFDSILSNFSTAHKNEKQQRDWVRASEQE